MLRNGRGHNSEKPAHCDEQWPPLAATTILISGKIDFKINTIISDKEGHYIMIKGSIQEEDITIVNIYLHPT